MPMKFNIGRGPWQNNSLNIQVSRGSNHAQMEVLTIKFQRKREEGRLPKTTSSLYREGSRQKWDYAVTPPGKLLFTSAMISSNLSDRNTTILHISTSKQLIKDKFLAQIITVIMAFEQKDQHIVTSNIWKQDKVALWCEIQTFSKASFQRPQSQGQNHPPRWNRPHSRCRVQTLPQSAPPQGLQKPQPESASLKIGIRKDFS